MALIRHVTATAVFRGAVRTGAVFCLLLAALSLIVGVDEYPGHTPAALRYLAMDVLPLLAVGVTSVAMLDAKPGEARWLVLLVTEVSIGLLALALPSARTGAPPYAFMLAGAAALLVIGTVGMAFSRA
jgi:hypothetical protein